MASGGRRGAKRKARGPGRAPRPAAARAISAECKRLLEQLRQRCPDALPPDPLPHGTVGPELPFKADEVSRLAVAIAVDGGAPAVVWSKDGSELLVFAGKVRVQLASGLVLVTIPVQCAEAGSAMIQVPFAVGDERRPAGLLVATEERPRGPAAVVDLWGDALIAFAWKILMGVATQASAASGADESGAGLIPAAIVAQPDGLRVQTMARFAFDRARR